jgi:hypothetical protein
MGLFCTVASADYALSVFQSGTCPFIINRWKLDELSAGCTIKFRRISFVNPTTLYAGNAAWLERVQQRDEAQTTEFQLGFALTD